MIAASSATDWPLRPQYLVISAETAAQMPFSPKAPSGRAGSGESAAMLVLRGALGQVLGKLSQAANGAGLHASGRQGSQDGVTDSRKGLEGVRAGVRGQPSHKRLVDVKDQRLGLG